MGSLDCNVIWLIFRVMYEDTNLNSNEIYEAYFISKNKNKFCYSEWITRLINKSNRFDVNKAIIGDLDFDDDY
ncbi:hypothetical protein [Photorhabdus australis]|uniref:hypothetical protein n=1 Tax=Photorhabdus australis TaxID=286156 RepID=UPI000569EE7F